ncbi:MAG: type VI secretion system baseplate subunit TssG [Acidobacteria bacterium]|nr:type VI secretion system baseplate subunit TssG [Acidobacteriota bacterium]MBK7933372.1 type VI secretion system baseplate subunit TssG [Acidobacteriota bacterium]
MAQKSLNKQLFEEPYSFEFFQAVRILEKLKPNRHTVGGTALPGEEVVRFRSRIGLDFPSSEIHEINEIEGRDGTADRTEMLVNFMGLVGVSGVLPTHYTELVLDRIRHRDTAMWSFLDIFTHRAVSLFYRSWLKYRFPAAYEQGSDDFTSYLFDFAGLGTKGLCGNLDLEDEALLPYAGLISQRPHNVNALENIISDHFQTKAKVVQFFGQWLHLGPEDISKLGKDNSCLGGNAIIGTRVWDQQSKIRISLGPLDFKRFQAFLPNGTANASLRSIVKFYVGLEFDFDLQLILAAKAVPATILTTRAVRKPALGWTTYLKTKPFTNDDGQVVLQ